MLYFPYFNNKIQNRPTIGLQADMHYHYTRPVHCNHNVTQSTKYVTAQNVFSAVDIVP